MLCIFSRSQASCRSVFEYPIKLKKGVHVGILKGQARVEYLAHKPLIQASLDEGYTLVYIYQKLKAEGKLTLSYKRLAVFVADEKGKRPQNLSGLSKLKTNTDTLPRILKIETNNVFKQDHTNENLYEKLIN